jgi:hypothetical protein
MVERAKKAKDVFQAFYTECSGITGYMIKLLNIQDSMSLLEPCAGKGAFLEPILEARPNVNVDAYELNSTSCEFLESKFGDSVDVVNCNFFSITAFKQYDRIIANPPYGAYLTEDERSSLKKEFPKIYAKETYGLFLAKSLSMLKLEGRAVFIIPDTFLTLRMHKGLRELLLTYKINSITKFPSKLFPGVKFGYAGLSIISVTNAIPDENHKFPIHSGISAVSEFDDIILNSCEPNDNEVFYRNVKKLDSLSFLSISEPWIYKALDSGSEKIGDCCDVVTGFYSGNDGHYLKRAPSVTRGVKKYQVIEKESIFEREVSNEILNLGIKGAKHWVPIVKGGNKRFHKPSEWYMDWSVEAVHEYRVTNRKKARYQNSQFYFKQGVAVPMVSSSSITGSLIDHRLFDQSIVGVFPKSEDPKKLFYLLGFFNSSVCNTLIRTINGSTNNSANYIKNIPIIWADDSIVSEVSDCVTRIFKTLENSSDPIDDQIREIDKLFNSVYGI